MRPSKLFFLFIILLTWSTLAPCQNLESLEEKLLQNIPDTSRVAVLLEIAKEVRYSDPEKMYAYSNEAKRISLEIQDGSGLVKSLFQLMTYFDTYRDEDSIEYYYQASLKLADSLNDETTQTSIQNARGLYLVSKRNFEEALELFYIVLRKHEQTNDLNGQMGSQNNIGYVFMELRQYEKAIKQFKIALTLLENPHPFILNNIGSCYGSLMNYDSATYYTEWAIKRAKEENNLYALANGLNIIGDLYLSTKQYEKALSKFLEAEQLRALVPSPAMLISDLTNISSLYAKLNQPLKGIEYGEKALRLAREEKLDYKIENVYQALAENYEVSNNYRLSAEYYKKWGIQKDSSYAQAQSNALVELQTKYETEKKEKQIVLQNFEISAQKAENQRKMLVIFALCFGIMMLAIILILVRSRNKKRQQLIIQQGEIKMKQTQVEAALNSQELERKRFARDLHDGFGQMISVLNLNLKSLEKGESDREEVFQNSSKVLDDMYKELKGICFNLMPETLIKNGVVDAIKEFGNRVNLTGKLILEVDTFGITERLNDLQEISIYRITQEWVNNILKYSDADKVTVSLTKDEEEITLLIEDNGSGFDKQKLIEGTGNGWKNMNSRANLIKGELELDTKLGAKGSTLIVNVPVKVIGVAPAQEIPA